MTGKAKSLLFLSFAAVFWAAVADEAALDASNLVARARRTLDGNVVEGAGTPWFPFRGCEPSVPGGFRGVWNWDGAFHAMALVRRDAELARDQFRIMMKFQGDDGMLPDVVWEDPSKGVFRGCTKPPVWAWAVWAMDCVAPDDAFLLEAYRALVRYEKFWRTKRFSEKYGMFHYDGNSDDPALRKKYCGWESGWDDSPRWDGNPGEVLPVDLNCWMVLYYNALRDVARRLGFCGDSALWTDRGRALASRLETLLWDGQDGCYYDFDMEKNGFSRVLTPASLMPLFIGTASQERADAMAVLAKRLEPGWPTVAYDHPEYRPDGYWRGRTWLNVAYFALRGLKFYGHDDVAERGRKTLIGWVARHGESIHENYNPETGAPLGCRDFGWSAAFVVKFVEDWHLPREVEMPVLSETARPRCFGSRSCAAETFLEDGRLVVGVNYWGSKAGVRMWRADEWDEASVEKDVAALAASGVELMRVFPTWGDFQPLKRERKFGGMPGAVLTDGGDEEVFDPLWIDPGAAARFDAFCAIAARHNVRLMVSLVTGWMSGRLFAPRIVENKNLLSDPDALMWEGRFARAFVRRMKGHDAIVAWDLGNECNCMGAVEGQAQVWNWINTVSSAIRIEDPSRPVVSGMHSQTSNGHGAQWGKRNDWTLQIQGELLDVLSPHAYPAPWRNEANKGAFNSFRNALHPVSQCLFYSAVSGKPAFPQEVGSLGPRICPEGVSALGMRQQMFACWQHGLGAYIWWCAFDQLHLGYPPFGSNAMERELGMLHADAARTPKPQALALKAFRAFRDSLPFRSLPPRRTDAVCLVAEREEFCPQAFGAFMLSKAAGFDLEFAVADSREIPVSRFYILPSGTGWETYGQRTWEALMERARLGATVLVTRGAETGYSNWLEFTGLEQTTYRKPRRVSFDFEGRGMSFADDFTAEQKPVDCEVAAMDSDGNVVLSVKRIGKGKVVVVNFAIEKCVAEAEGNAVDGDFSNELWRIYAFAAREAGVKRLVSREDPRLAVTEHPCGDGRVLVCALNTRPEKADFDLTVRGDVEEAFNCQWGDGRLTLEGNDGGVLKVKTAE